MLVFKKNIYEQPSACHPENGTQQNLNAHDFIFRSLTTDREILYGLQQLPEQEGQAHFKTLFPHASKFGTISLLNTFSRTLLEGLVDRSQWYTMNAYHMTYLFDSLHGAFEDYSYSEPEQRNEICPELMGEAIDFDHFLENYFSGTAFLMDAERYNDIAPDEKVRLKLTVPCLFGVINRLIPAEEEVRLITNSETPYSS